jgi:hypothetical protein
MYALAKTDSNPLLTGWTTEEETLSTYASDSNEGVDFLHLGFDVSPDYGDFDSHLWSMDRWGTERVPDFMHPQLFYTLPFGETNVEVELRTLDWRCYLRFNPSRAVYGKSKNLLPAGAVEPLVEKLLYKLQPLVFPSFVQVTATGEFVNEPGWASQVSVSRIDCAKNLFITEPQKFKQAAMRSQPVQNPTIHSFGKKGSSWGLVHGTATVGKDRLYDKDADLLRFDVEASITQEKGDWFRFEAELRADRIKKFGLTRLSDISEEAVWNVIFTRWEASRWGVTINSPGSIVNTLAGLSVNDKSNLLGYHALHLLHLEDEIPVSRHRKYGKLASDLGIKLDEPLETQGAPTMRVDIREGKIVDC